MDNDTRTDPSPTPVPDAPDPLDAEKPTLERELLRALCDQGPARTAEDLAAKLDADMALGRAIVQALSPGGLTQAKLEAYRQIGASARRELQRADLGVVLNFPLYDAKIAEAVADAPQQAITRTWARMALPDREDLIELVGIVRRALRNEIRNVVSASRSAEESKS